MGNGCLQNHQTPTDDSYTVCKCLWMCVCVCVLISFSFLYNGLKHDVLPEIQNCYNDYHYISQLENGLMQPNLTPLIWSCHFH